MCDAYLQNIPDAVWTEFEAKFGGEINNLDWKKDHWRYDKRSSKIQ